MEKSFVVEVYEYERGVKKHSHNKYFKTEEEARAFYSNCGDPEDHLSGFYDENSKNYNTEAKYIGEDDGW